MKKGPYAQPVVVGRRGRRSPSERVATEVTGIWGPKMNVIINEQLAALSLLIAFLFGITFGVFGGAVHGSRRGVLLVPAADDLLSAGARVIYGVCTRDEDGYPQGLLTGEGQASPDPRGDDSSASHRREADR